MHEVTNVMNFGNIVSIGDHIENEDGQNEVPKEFHKLTEDTETNFHPSCKTFTRLEFIMTLLHIKVSCKWSDKSFSMLLRSLQRAFNNDKNFTENS